MIVESTEQRITFHKPALTDAAFIHTLIQRCPPLDVNSLYLYLLLCHHYPDTCVVAKREGQVVGFVSGYFPPNDRDALFIWQVAVDGSCRGQGLAGRMLTSILERPEHGHATALHTTVSPSNAASQRLFRKFAEKLNTNCAEEPLFQEQHFGEENHEEEVLFRIGPITRNS